jgi:hypothetical protein
MKSLLVFLLSITCISANAHGYDHRHYGHYHGGYGYGWVAPTIIGGVIGYEIARQNQPVIVQQQPVIVQQPIYTQPTVPGTTCTPWQVVQMPDGTYTQTRTCQ